MKKQEKKLNTWAWNFHHSVNVKGKKNVAQIQKLVESTVPACACLSPACRQDRADRLKADRSSVKCYLRLIGTIPNSVTVSSLFIIYRKWGVFYHRGYICQLLCNLGFSWQKARFVSDHLDVAKRQAWKENWPNIVTQAQQTGALLLFEDEASFPQWGSISYTWALKGHQPTVLTTGKRKGYKVFGAIDYFSGRLFYLMSHRTIQ